MFQLASIPCSRPVRYSGAQNMPPYKLKRFVLGDQGLAELQRQIHSYVSLRTIPISDHNGRYPKPLSDQNSSKTTP